MGHPLITGLVAQNSHVKDTEPQSAPDCDITFFLYVSLFKHGNYLVLLLFLVLRAPLFIVSAPQ